MFSAVMSSAYRRRLLVAAAGVLVALTAVVLSGHGTAGAISASVTPSQQTVQSGQTASWGAAWGDQAPYAVTFSYGDGGSWSTSSASTTSRPFERTFITCSTRSYTQRLDVREINTSATVMATASTSVIGGAWCR